MNFLSHLKVRSKIALIQSITVILFVGAILFVVRGISSIIALACAQGSRLSPRLSAGPIEDGRESTMIET